MSLLPIRRVVVVDPDASHRLFVCETLKLLGVPAVEDCAALLGREAAGADLVIFGSDANAGLALSPLGESALIVLTPTATQARSPGFAAACLSWRPDMILPKPFTRSVLLKALKDLVAGPAGRRLKVVEFPGRPPIRMTRAPQPPAWLDENSGAPQA